MAAVFFIAVLALSWCTAQAQQPAPPTKVYTFTDLSPADVALLGKALVKLPYEEVANLLAKMQKQINEQDQPANPPQAGKEEPKK
jgi:hypothetical protein